MKLEKWLARDAWTARRQTSLLERCRGASSVETCVSVK